MLEKQHNQLVSGLQEMYQRLRKASLWDGEPLDESSGRPLTHDILAVLNLLEPKKDGSDESGMFEDFIEQPQSEPILRKRAVFNMEILISNDEVHHDLSQPTSHCRATPIVPDLSVHVKSSISSSMSLSPTNLVPRQQLGQPKPSPRIPQERRRQLLPAVSSPVQMGALWDGPLYCFPPAIVV